jgi:uncharacterized protein (TIGR01440 family)
MENIRLETIKVIEEILSIHPLKQNDIFVIGCSSSEILGGVIGQNSSEEIGKIVFSSAEEILSSKGIFLACQCCEHLNRALVVSSECADKYSLEEVCVVPQVKAGGSLATAAYNNLKNPVVVENIKAHAGLDIGGTLIGMHLKAVAVPIYLKNKMIGEASVIAAYSRPKLIGGQRAIYH